MLPGAGYGTLGPALRLPRLAAEETGAEVVEVEYPAPPAPGGQVQQQDLQDAASSQVSSFLSGSAPDRVTFNAKSLGTMVLGGLRPSVPLPPLVKAIWLTPEDPLWGPGCQQSAHVPGEVFETIAKEVGCR